MSSSICIPYVLQHCTSDVLVVDCGTPPSVSGGAVVTVSPYPTTYESNVQYACLPGYSVMEGTDTITCQADVQWSDAPVCHGKYKSVYISIN